MKIVLSILICFTTCLSHGAITADFVMHGEGLARGLADEATIGNGIVGETSASCSGATNANFTRLFLVAPPVTNQLPVTVNGTTYNGGTNWWQFITQTNIGDDQLAVQIATDDVTSPVGNIHLFGLARFCITNNTGALVNYDPIRIYGGGGSWFTSQIQMQNSSAGLWVAHSQGATGGTVSQTFGTILWELVKDYTNNMGYFRIRDADNGYAVIGSGSVAVPVQEGAGLTWKLEFPIGYIGDPEGTIYLGDYFARYNVAAQFLTDAELTGTQPRVLSVNRANVGRVQRP